jgi:hypothetical protein
MAESVSSGPATEPLLDMDMSSADMSFEMDSDESNLDSARSGGESERGASRGARGRGARSGARGRGARRGGRRQYNPPLASVEERHRVQRLRDGRVNRIKVMLAKKHLNMYHLEHIIALIILVISNIIGTNRLFSLRS